MRDGPPCREGGPFGAKSGAGFSSGVFPEGIFRRRYHNNRNASWIWRG
jgi:hypothetical protein